MNISQTPEYKRAYREANKEKYAEYTRKTRDKRRGIVKSLKEVPCADCGKEYPHYVMDFDHREDKLFDISSAMFRVGLQKLLDEIKKCEVVCSNCHRMRTFA
jgi:hypothetical protein